ncbi:MAG TPA: shikimate dehydrogenase [Candidatus Limnocylindria bacterium]|nr:shikimate dehydrogenase [Candidatus Limnocylindria bacterium]
MGRVVLLGHPVSHSLSPPMHNAAFAALGLPHRYETLDVAPDALSRTIDALRRDETLGANVTIPHKEAAIRLMDETSDEVRAIGALNTIVRRGSRLAGHNTDAYGFERATAGIGEGDALLLGAGGAARACALVLLRQGRRVLVANRSRRRAEDLARTLEVAGRRPQVVAWPTGRELATPIVVNATPLGMHGEDPLRGLALPRCVVDIVPTAVETPLVRRAREAQHVLVVDGLSMLLHQAARSFELWTGLPAPLEVMRAALPRPA